MSDPHVVRDADDQHSVDPEWDDQPWSALGSVLEDGRGSLPFALVHGESLVACAAAALDAAGILTVDLGTTWADLADSGLPLVLHDPLCPLTPPAFLADCVAQAVAHDAVVVGTRPVTDTVKEVVDGRVGATVDRDGLVLVASPVVLPASALAALDALPGTDLAELVTALSARFPVRRLPAPPEARRVSVAGDLPVLEALTRPARHG